MKKINVLQSWRAIFIVLICIEHMALQNKIALLGAGAEGVSFFILLSGFLTGYIYQNKEIDCSFSKSKDFLFKKLKKFYPLHIIAIVLSVILELLYILKNFSVQVDRLLNLALKAVLNATFLQVYIPVDGIYMNNIHGVGWFLSTIVFCYANSLIGLKAIKYFNKKNKDIFLFGIVFVVYITIIFFFKDSNLNQFILYVFPPVRYLEYFIAMIFGFSYNHIYAHIKDKIYLWGLFEGVSVILLVVNHLGIKMGMYRESNYKYLTIFICSFVIIFVFSMEKGIISKLLNNKFLIDIGNASFYVYIMHQVIIKYVTTVFGWNNLGAIVSAFVIIIFTYITYNYDKLFKKKCIV